MPQLSLFDAAAEVLVDDATGRIEYVPGLVSPQVAAGWFAELREAVDWEAKRRVMYDREVDVPRLTAHFPLPPEPASPRAIGEAAQRVTARVRAPFNAVGLNLYRDGRDSVAPHNDHLYEIVAGFPIGTPVARRHAPDEHPLEGAFRAAPEGRPRERQPAGHELRHPAPLHARRPQDPRRSGGSASASHSA
jgi:hypothetical protein